MKRATPMTVVFALLGFLLLLFLALPLITLFAQVTPGLLIQALQDSEVVSSILLTLHMGVWATLIALLLGIPLAYILARTEFRGKQLVETFVDLPLVVPHTAAGLALLSVFGQAFYGGKAFGIFGLEFVGARPGIVIAMLFVSAPILINAVREGFASVDPRLEEMARTLGAGPWRVFRTVTLPLTRRSILAGATTMWARGISEFGAVFILVYHPMVAPVLLWRRFESYGLEQARPVAAVLLLTCIAIFLILRALRRSMKGPKP